MYTAVDLTEKEDSKADLKWIFEKNGAEDGVYDPDNFGEYPLKSTKLVRTMKILVPVKYTEGENGKKKHGFDYYTTALCTTFKC